VNESCGLLELETLPALKVFSNWKLYPLPAGSTAMYREGEFWE